jgi:hypothetical protein
MKHDEGASNGDRLIDFVCELIGGPDGLFEVHEAVDLLSHALIGLIGTQPDDERRAQVAQYIFDRLRLDAVAVSKYLERGRMQ